MCTTSCPVNSVHFTLQISLCVIQLHITLQSHGCVLEVHTILCTISAHYTVDTAIYLILCLTQSSLSPRYREQTVHSSELNCHAHYCEVNFSVSGLSQSQSQSLECLWTVSGPWILGCFLDCLVLVGLSGLFCIGWTVWTDFGLSLGCLWTVQSGVLYRVVYCTECTVQSGVLYRLYFTEWCTHSLA